MVQSYKGSATQAIMRRLVSSGALLSSVQHWRQGVQQICTVLLASSFYKIQHCSSIDTIKAPQGHAAEQNRATAGLLRKVGHLTLQTGGPAGGRLSLPAPAAAGAAGSGVRQPGA